MVKLVSKNGGKACTTRATQLRTKRHRQTVSWSEKTLPEVGRLRNHFDLNVEWCSLIVILSKRLLRSEGSGRAERRVAFFATHQSRVWLASFEPLLPSFVPLL
jgi:hypothetical protein